MPPARPRSTRRPAGRTAATGVVFDRKVVETRVAYSPVGKVNQSIYQDGGGAAQREFGDEESGMLKDITWFWFDLACLDLT